MEMSGRHIVWIDGPPRWHTPRLVKLICLPLKRRLEAVLRAIHPLGLVTLDPSLSLVTLPKYSSEKRSPLMPRPRRLTGAVGRRRTHTRIVAVLPFPNSGSWRASRGSRSVRQVRKGRVDRKSDGTF